MKPENRPYWIAGGIVAALCAAWFLSGLIYLRRFAPGDDVHTFAQLQQQGVPMTRAVRLSNPAGFICVFGDFDRVKWTLASGPPAYIFDAKGTLAAFAIDTGDSPKFRDEYKVQDGTELPIPSLPAYFAQPAPDASKSPPASQPN